MRRDVCLEAAQKYRVLRRKCVTVREAIDTIIATCRIQSGYEPLHCDHDFDAQVKHPARRVAAPQAQTPRFTRGSDGAKRRQ